MLLEQIRSILGTVLGLKDRGASLDRDSALMGSLPEFDSMAVVAILTAIESQFGIVIEDDEIDASTFETVGSLADFVQAKVA